MAHNHLIIGLGGTGGSIIRSFRKAIYQAYETDTAPVNIRYLYIDSSKSDLDPYNQSWTILGHSVSLPDYSRLPISGHNLKEIIDDPRKGKNVKPWIGNRSDWIEIINSMDASRAAAGQKRRLGRLLFASQVELFNEKIHRFVSDMETDNSEGKISSLGATFHVCCGLAGGTGSGILVDVISQIRKTHPESRYKIIVYAQLPEVPAEGNRAQDNYHANGYAALMELNALKIRSWRPHDLAFTDKRRLDILDPFNACYLFSNVTESSDEQEGGTKVKLEELPEILASFLFQKIVQAPNIRWATGGDQIERQEMFENIDAARYAEKSPRGEPRRTRIFLSFGIKQIAYPENEVREYLTYSFAQQVGRQLLFNNQPNESEGYRDEPTKFPCEEFVAEPKRQEHWFLDDQHLMLSRGILQSEIDNKSWRPIGEFWKELVPKLVVHVLDQYKDSVVKMMPELIRLCEAAYNEQYRGHGVRSFYEIKRGDLDDHVQELRQRIESDLFSSWRNGVLSMHDIERVVMSLISALSSRLQAIDLSITKISENGERFALNESKYRDNNLAWGKLGPLSNAFGKHKKILSAQAEVLVERYTMRTQLEGYHYARKLVEMLRQEMNSLSTNVGYCKATIIEAKEAFKAGMSSRLTDAGNKDIGKPVVRQYDPSEVRKFVEALSQDGKRQKTLAGEVRKRLVGLLNNKLTFASFAQAISSVAFQNVLSECCAQSSEAAHAAAITANPRQGRILRVELLDLLRSDYDGNPDKLRRFASKIMEKAMNYLVLGGGEKGSSPSGTSSAVTTEPGICTTNNFIIAPEASGEAAGFREKFCNALKESTTHGECIIATNQQRSQEITIITLTSVFPPRFAELVRSLKTAYEARIAVGGKRAFLELHSEGESLEVAPDQEIFDLFPEAYRPADILPWMMLAQSLQLIVAKEDDTGRSMLYFDAMGSDGLPNFKLLGPNRAAALENPHLESIEEMKFKIRRLLQGEHLHIGKRKELESMVVTTVLATAETAGATSPLYSQEREALSTVRKILELES
jgi:Tubulin like